MIALMCYHNLGIYDDCKNGTAEVICKMPNAGQEYTTESDTSLCNDGEVRLFEVRLFDGENFNQREGRVEMCFNGVWGAVCADGWDEVAANIVCTQLGYENGIIRSIFSVYYYS